jgi:predicted tellurium resistance membrane protein TerC
MGLLATIATPIERLLETLPLYQTILLGFVAFITLAICANVLRQVLFKDKNAPPEVFSLFPVLGSTYVALR